MKFNLKYFLLTILLFIAEVLIATTFKKVFFLRAYFGDVLVVILIYTFILSFFQLQKAKLIFRIFIFSCVVEFLQYFHFGELLGFKNNKIAMVVLGNSFSWIDITCYTIGCLSIWLLDVNLKNKFKLAQK
jgi:hypothetical protein